MKYLMLSLVLMSSVGLYASSGEEGKLKRRPALTQMGIQQLFDYLKEQQLAAKRRQFVKQVGQLLLPSDKELLKFFTAIRKGDYDEWWYQKK